MVDGRARLALLEKNWPPDPRPIARTAPLVLRLERATQPRNRGSDLGESHRRELAEHATDRCTIDNQSNARHPSCKRGCPTIDLARRNNREELRRRIVADAAHRAGIARGSPKHHWNPGK